MPRPAGGEEALRAQAAGCLAPLLPLTRPSQEAQVPGLSAFRRGSAIGSALSATFQPLRTEGNVRGLASPDVGDRMQLFWKCAPQNSSLVGFKPGGAMIPKFGNAGFFICVNMLICIFSFPPMLLPTDRSVSPQIDAVILAHSASDLALSGNRVTADGISYDEVFLE